MVSQQHTVSDVIGQCALYYLLRWVKLAVKYHTCYRSASSHRGGLGTRARLERVCE